MRVLLGQMLKMVLSILTGFIQVKNIIEIIESTQIHLIKPTKPILWVKSRRNGSEY